MTLGKDTSFHNHAPVAERKRRNAAMYVRMSTDHQKYSTENQADAIREYAERHQIDIIQTYTDSGKSGLRIDGREALQQLITDVQNKDFNFSMILVLDVTRWGRFQDADESAYYEYICRAAGIDVQYVAEQFENDGSPVSTIVKGVKRAMAGEYSRELSGKVFAGQCRLIELGYRQGGPAGYGLRRMLVDEHGQEKATLKRGEHKSLQTDRVILIPGPEEEIENVQWMYRAFCEGGMQESQIAGLLNQRGILTDLARAWTRSTVHQVLTNEKYIGNNIFNRISYKLKKRRVVNAREMWVKNEGAFEGIVEQSYFYTAQGIIRERSRRLSDDDMLAKLKALHDKEGWLSGVIIDEAEDMPTSTAYQYRFGSLTRAYRLIGYHPERDYKYIELNRFIRQSHSAIMDEAIEQIKAMGGSVQRNDSTDILTINDSLKVSVVICRCHQSQAGSLRWQIFLDTGLEPDITLVIRMDEWNKAPMDYYIIPALDVENPQIRLAENNSLALDAYRFDDLEEFYLLTQNVSILEVA